MGPFRKYVHSEGSRGYFKSARKCKRGERSSVFSRKKQCVYCNSYVRQNLCVRCSLNFEFGTYDVIKCILTQHVNNACILLWNRVFCLPLWAKTRSSKSIYAPRIFFNSRIFTSLLLTFVFYFFIEKVKTVTF